MPRTAPSVGVRWADGEGGGHDRRDPEQLSAADQGKEVAPRLVWLVDPAEQAILLIHQQQHTVLWADRLEAGRDGRGWHRLAFLCQILMGMDDGWLACWQISPRQAMRVVWWLRGYGREVYCTAASCHFPWSVTQTWVTRNRLVMVSPLVGAPGADDPGVGAISLLSVSQSDPSSALFTLSRRVRTVSRLIVHDILRRYRWWRARDACAQPSGYP